MAYEALNFDPLEVLTSTKMDKLAANDASFHDGTGIDDDAIVARHMSNGSDWAFTSFTPSWTNLTVGTGGSAHNSGYYFQLGKLIIGYTRTVLGSSGASVGSSPYFNAPVNQSSNYNTSYNYSCGTCWITDAGTQQYIGYMNLNGTGSGNRLHPITIVVNSGARAFASGVTSGDPMTWTAGDAIQTQFMYEVA